MKKASLTIVITVVFAIVNTLSWSSVVLAETNGVDYENVVNLFSDNFDGVVIGDTGSRVFENGETYNGYVFSYTSENSGNISIAKKDGNNAMKFTKNYTGVTNDAITARRNYSYKLPDKGKLKVTYDINFENNTFSASRFPGMYFEDTANTTAKERVIVNSILSGKLGFYNYLTSGGYDGILATGLGKLDTVNSGSLNTKYDCENVDKWLNIGIEIDMDNCKYDYKSTVRDTGEIVCEGRELPYYGNVQNLLTKISKFEFLVKESSSQPPESKTGVYWLDNLNVAYVGKGIMICDDTFEDETSPYTFANNKEYKGYKATVQNAAGTSTGTVTIESNNDNKAIKIKETIIPGETIGYVTLQRMFNHKLPKHGVLDVQCDVNFEKNIYRATQFPGIYFNKQDGKEGAMSKITTDYADRVKMSEYPTGTSNYGRIIDNLGSFDAGTATYTEGKNNGKWVRIHYKIDLNKKTFDVNSCYVDTGETLYSYTDMPYGAGVGDDFVDSITKLFFRIEEVKSYTSENIGEGIYWIDNVKYIYYGDEVSLYDFSVNDSSGNAVTNLLDVAGEKVSVKYTEVNNNTDSGKSYICVFTIYDDKDNLISATISDGVGGNSGSSDGAVLDIPSDAKSDWKIKCFCWNNIENLVPLTNVISVYDVKAVN